MAKLRARGFVRNCVYVCVGGRGDAHMYADMYINIIYLYIYIYYILYLSYYLYLIYKNFIHAFECVLNVYPYAAPVNYSTIRRLSRSLVVLSGFLKKSTSIYAYIVVVNTYLPHLCAMCISKEHIP